MCGIAGWIVASPGGVSRACAAIPRMLASLEHRGPDDHGIYQEGPLLLGHLRLSILDLSDLGHQPMRSADGRYVICYNGEVYNFRALAAELAQAGHRFLSGSDTEVILAAWAAWGLAALPRFDGMFGLAIWDREEQELLLARDRTGIKPLYYHEGPDGLLFASELKAIWSALPASGPDMGALRDLVLFGRLEGGLTGFAGVKALPAGQYMVFGADGRPKTRGDFHRVAEDISQDRFAALSRLPDHAQIQRLDELLQKSVDLHLASDAPVGVLCSGGVDSSLITAMVHRRNPDVGIFHACFDGAGSEQPYAEEVASHLGCRIDYASMTRGYYLRTLVKAIWHSDAPLYHPNDISLYSVCELARQRACKVLLSGEGADELFGGYLWHETAFRRYRALAGLGRLIQRSASLSARLTHLAHSLLDDLLFPEDALWGVCYPGHARRLLAQSAQGMFAGGAAWRSWHEGLAAYGFLRDPVERRVQALLYSNLFGHMDSILRRNDRMGMMASIENRVPFIENDILAHGLNLPLSFKIRGRQGKWVLKEVAARYLPRDVVFRPKAGFPVPWVRYLGELPATLWRGGFLSAAFELTPDLIAAWIRGAPDLRFRLLNIELWGRLFASRQPLDQVESWFLEAMGEVR